MSDEKLNLPFTGIASFAKVPIHEDLSTLEADVAIIGAPYDLGTQVRIGDAPGPTGIRNASTIYGLRSVRTTTRSSTRSSSTAFGSSTAGTST